MMDNRWAIGIDLGGTKIAIGLVREGKVHHRLNFHTKAEAGPQAVIQDVLEGILSLREQVNQEVLPVGIGMAGQIDPQTGEVRFSPNLKWRNVPLQAELYQSLNQPVFVTNDVRAATYGEWHHGAGKGIDDLLCIFVGTGIGGGIISGGRLLTGHTNIAGEIGHLPIDFHGPVCGCGGRGCFEAFAGGWAIARRAKELMAKHHSEGNALIELAGGHEHLISAKIVFEAAHQGDALAKKIVEEVTEALISGVTGLVNVLNPEYVVLGGGVIQGIPEVVSFIRLGVKKYALKSATESLQIMESQLGGEAGVIGAASMVLEKFFKEK